MLRYGQHGRALAEDAWPMFDRGKSVKDHLCQHRQGYRFLYTLMHSHDSGPGPCTAIPHCGHAWYVKAKTWPELGSYTIYNEEWANRVLHINWFQKSGTSDFMHDKFVI